MTYKYELIVYLLQIKVHRHKRKEINYKDYLQWPIMQEKLTKFAW